MNDADHGREPEEVRMDIAKIAPEAYRHLLQLEGLIARHLDKNLLHLVKLRASQINGCAFCIAMHTQEALSDGEAPVRLTSLDAWRETPLYSRSERAALAWVEEITLVAERGASLAAYEQLREAFDDAQVAWLTLASTAINSWNRIAIASRARYAGGS